MKRFLLLRGGALGDFIVTLPALAAIRATWPGVQLEIVGNARAATLALRTAGRGLLDAAHPQSDARWMPLFDATPLPPALARWLRSFDAIASFFPDPEGTLARHLATLERPHLCAPAQPARAPAAAHFTLALAPLGVRPASPLNPLDAWRLPLQLAPLDHVAAHGALGDWAGREFLALHPGSGSPRKNWPPARWRELVLALLARGHSRLLVTAGEADDAAAAALTALPVRFDPGWPLPTLAAVLAQAKTFLGHDSGIAHVAAATGTRCVLIWGPTDPTVWAPPGRHVQVLTHGADPRSVSVAVVLVAV